MNFTQERANLVRGLKNKGIIQSAEVEMAMNKVPRHLFVPQGNQRSSYRDSPQAIGKGQTISAPHMNAMMCEALKIGKNQKILEIGTGSGYHAALLAELVGKRGCIISIERHPELAKKAETLLNSLGYENIQVITGDGTMGYPSQAPYDGILVTAAGPKIPDALIQQLTPANGILCIPVGPQGGSQDLVVLKKNGTEITKNTVCKVVFVPLIGEEGFLK